MTTAVPPGAPPARVPSPGQLGAIVDLLPDAVVAADASGTIVVANQAAHDLLGFPGGSLAGRPLSDLVTPDQRAAHRDGFARVAARGSSARAGGPPLRVTARRADGRDLEVEVSLSVSGPAGEDGLAVVGCIRDATDRATLEQQMISVRYLRAVLAAADHLQRSTDPDTVLGDVLAVLCRHLDWQFAALWVHDATTDRLRCLHVWHPPTEAADDFAADTRMRSLGRGEALPGRAWVEARTVVADRHAPAHWQRPGGEHYRAGVAFPVAGSDGLLAVVELLSSQSAPAPPELADLLTAVGRQAGLFIERLRAEEEAQRTEQELRYRAALLAAQIDSAPQAVLAVSTDRRVMAVNRRFEELWRLPPGSVKVGEMSPALRPEILELVRHPEAFEATLRWGHQHPDEDQHLEVPLVDGRVIEGVSGPVVDDTGTYRGRIWFLNDDTERRRVEEERAELLERLRRALRSQNFLLQAGRVLAQAHGYQETLEQLATVAVPALGDLCLIDVVGDDGVTRRMVARHADPTRQPLADQLRTRFPPDAGGPHPALAAIRTGRSSWSGEMTDEFLRSTTRDDEHLALTRALEFTSYMTVPLVADDEVLGSVTIVSAGSGRHFGPGDLTVAEDLADQVAQVVAKARRYDQEHRVAHALQANLLPASLPTVPGLDLAVRYVASPRAAEVGGDWFDAMVVAAGSVRLTVGDVAGHDVAAAAAMGQLRSAARALAGHAEDPAELVALLHDSWDDMGLDRMASLVVAQLNPADGALTVASAGHPPPLSITAAGHRVFLPVEPGPPLGVPVSRPGSQWKGWLEAGGSLLFYTDGLVEERAQGIDDGMARLADAVAAVAGQGCDGVPADALCEVALSTVGENRPDDIAVLAVTRRPAAP